MYSIKIVWPKANAEYCVGNMDLVLAILEKFKDSNIEIIVEEIQDDVDHLFNLE